MSNRPLEDIIAEMRTVGEQLVPYNFPQADPRLEDDLNAVKAKEAVVDGYPVVVHYSKADYRTHFLETVQILGKHVPFLPFSLVAKIARRFLGSNNLSLVELLKDSQKIYCWTVALDRRGRPIAGAHAEDAEVMKYDDFSYTYLDPSQVNTY
jgi:hypothetical protein